MNPVKSCVKRRMLQGKSAADALAILTTTCAAGAASGKVQGDPVCAAAQADLQAKVQAASACFDGKLEAEQAVKALGKKFYAAFQLARASLSTYETAVNGVAKGDAAIIHEAGVESRPENPASSPPVSRVEEVTYNLGKSARQSVLRWRPAPGAVMFAVEVNFEPQNPSAPWTSLGVTTRRTKVVTVPAIAGQFLARIRALSSDGTAADWSDTILATAR